jgi:hypothetical protein
MAPTEEKHWVNQLKTRGSPVQYACFVCRKSFKRLQFAASLNRAFMTSAQSKGQGREVKELEQNRTYKCPHCGGVAHYMGIDFKAPKISDRKAWIEVESFIRSGKVYYRNRE